MHSMDQHFDRLAHAFICDCAGLKLSDFAMAKVLTASVLRRRCRAVCPRANDGHRCVLACACCSTRFCAIYPSGGFSRRVRSAVCSLVFFLCALSLRLAFLFLGAALYPARPAVRRRVFARCDVPCAFSLFVSLPLPRCCPPLLMPLCWCRCGTGRGKNKVGGDKGVAVRAAEAKGRVRHAPEPMLAILRIRYSGQSTARLTLASGSALLELPGRRLG